MGIIKNIESITIIVLLITLGVFSTLDLPSIILTQIVIAFYALFILLLYINKSKFDIEGKVAFLYRTKVGLNLMDWMASKIGGLIRAVAVFSIFIAYLGLTMAVIFFGKQTYDTIIKPSIGLQVSPVIPGVEVVGTGLTFPLVIGWISLFIIICVHEFSHGVVARSFKIPIKSSGFVFFGPIPGAFVEPDEKVLVKQKAYKQLAVFAAGPVSNIFLTLIILVVGSMILVPSFNSMTYSEGIDIMPIVDDNLPLYSNGITERSVLAAINGNETKDYIQLDNMLSTLKPGVPAILTINGKEITITPAPHPDNASRPYIGFNMNKLKMDSFLLLGISKTSPKNDNLFNRIIISTIKWFDELLWWIMFISFNIGLFNLIPMFITDGARMTMLNFGKKGQKVWKILNFLMLGMILIIVFLPLFRGFLSSVGLAVL